MFCLTLSLQMERSPLITLTFHFRAVAILFLLASVDLLYMRYSWASLRTKGASVQIVFGLEVHITHCSIYLFCIQSWLNDIRVVDGGYIILRNGAGSLEVSSIVPSLVNSVIVSLLTSHFAAYSLQYTIMLFMAINTFLHYVLHSIDLRSEDPWENKTIFMRYVDIGVGERNSRM